MTSDLKKSFIILTRIKNQLVNIMPGLEWIVAQKMEVYNKTPSNYELIAKINSAQLTALHYIFTWYNSFEDEYQRYFISKDPPEMQKIKLIKTEAKAYLNQVALVFPNLKKARNRVLSHGYRDNHQQPITDEEINSLYNGLIIHESLQKFFLLAETAQKTITAIEKQFGPLTGNDISLVRDLTLDDEES